MLNFSSNFCLELKFYYPPPILFWQVKINGLLKVIKIKEELEYQSSTE